MNKDEMIKQVSEQLTVLKSHAESLAKLIEDLQLTVRPTASGRPSTVCFRSTSGRTARR